MLMNDGEAYFFGQLGGASAGRTVRHTRADRCGERSTAEGWRLHDELAMGVVVPRVTAAQAAAAGGVKNLISGLLDMLKSISSQMELREKGVAALRSLAMQSAENAVFIAAGLPQLVELTVSGSETAKVHAAATLAIVSRGNLQHQLSIGKLGGITALATLLKSGSSSVQEQAAAAVASISMAAANKEPAIKAGALPPLVSLLKSGSSEAQLHASEAVGNLASLVDAQMTVQKTGGIQRLLALLGSGKAQEFAARALAKLSHQNHAVQAEVIKNGGVALLLALLSGLSVEAQTQAAAAIAELAQGANGKNRKRTQDAIAKAGGIGPLLQLIESRYPHAVAEAVHAIAQVHTRMRVHVHAHAHASTCVHMHMLSTRSHRSQRATVPTRKASRRWVGCGR